MADVWGCRATNGISFVCKQLYNEETVRFDVRLDTTVIAYMKEQYGDSIKLDGKLGLAEHDTVVKEYLQDEDVMAAVDSAQISVRYDTNRSYGVCQGQIGKDKG